MDAPTLDHWRHGDALAVGQGLLGPLSPAERARRAARVLAVCRERWSPVRQLESLLGIAQCPSRWPEAHAAFRVIRDLTLAEERCPTHPIYGALLYVAENTAKTLYNASGAPAPFDDDSPWWVASTAQHLARVLDDPAFDSAVWAALTTPAQG